MARSIKLDGMAHLRALSLSICGPESPLLGEGISWTLWVQVWKNPRRHISASTTLLLRPSSPPSLRIS